MKECAPSKEKSKVIVVSKYGRDVELVKKDNESLFKNPEPAHKPSDR